MSSKVLFVCFAGLMAMSEAADPPEANAAIHFYLDSGSTGIKLFVNPVWFTHEDKDNEDDDDYVFREPKEKFPDGVTKVKKIEKGPSVTMPGIQRTFDTEEGKVAMVRDLKMAMKIVIETGKDLLGPATRIPQPDGVYQVKIMLAGTAGWRGRSRQDNSSMWGDIMDELVSDSQDVKCSVLDFKAQKRATAPDAADGMTRSGTVWGTQEAMMEAYTIMQITPPRGGGEFQGFFSTGGASAQFGLRLCSPRVEKKWDELLSDRATEVFNSQCHGGTSFSKQHFMSWSTEEDITANNGEKIQGYWRDFAGGAFCNNDEGPCWALGSLFQCPGYNEAVVLGEDVSASAGGVAGYKATYYSMVKQMTHEDILQDAVDQGKSITSDDVVQFFQRDTYIKALTEPVGDDNTGFMKAWIEDCLHEPTAKLAFGPAFPEQETQFRENEARHGLDPSTPLGPTLQSIRIAEQPPDGTFFKTDGWSPMNSWAWAMSLGFVNGGHLHNNLRGMNGDMDWGKHMGKLGARLGGDVWIEELEKDLKGLERSIHQLEK